MLLMHGTDMYVYIYNLTQIIMFLSCIYMWRLCRDGKSAVWYAAANGLLPVLRLLVNKYGRSSSVDERSNVSKQ